MISDVEWEELVEHMRAVDPQPTDLADMQPAGEA
jgi:hypothetical protein